MEPDPNIFSFNTIQLVIFGTDLHIFEVSRFLWLISISDETEQQLVILIERVLPNIRGVKGCKNHI